MIGPILMLKIRGFFCKCLESEEDRMIREAVIALTNLPVLWHDHEKRKNRNTTTRTPASDADETERNNQENSNRVGKFASQLWNSVSKNKFFFGSSKTWKSVPGTLSIVDSQKGPALLIQQQDVMDAESTTELSDNNKEDESMDTYRPKKLIPLRKIKKVTEYNTFLATRSSGIIIHGKKKQEDSDDTSDHDYDELLRIDIRSSKHTVLLATSDKRDEIMQYLLTLVKWDQRRRAKYERDKYGTEEEDGDSDDDTDRSLLGDDENNDTEVTSPDKEKRGTLSESEKIKRYEEREIELLQKKRERERRKARYLKEAGGLKYTAIAMANRA